MTAQSDEWLRERYRIWNEKPALRAIYADFYRRLETACPPGPLLDIGGGAAHFKTYRPTIISLDIQPFPGIDIVADAHDMPLPDASFAGIVMLDVLHHLQRPMVFMREAARVLRPGGRLAMIEPGMSLISTPCYSRFHHEPVIMTADPFEEGIIQSGSDPQDSNQALPTLMFATEAARAKLKRAVPELKIVSINWLSLIAYPLSGGFRRWSLLPSFMVSSVLRAEELTLRFLGPWIGFRLFIVLERL